MAVEKEIWKKDIVEALYASNPHLAFAINADDLVLAGKVVHIPQAGSSPSVTKNRAVFPAAAVRRTDTDVTYNLDEYSSSPVHIQDAEKVETSYNKRDSVLKDTKNVLSDAVGVDAFFKWFPAGGTIIRTSGSAFVDIVAAHLDAATGLRRALKMSDVKKAAKQFNNWNIPAEGRYLMIDAEMYDQLTNDMTANQQRDFLAAYDAATGVVGKLFGFNIMQRSIVLRLLADAAVDPTAAGAATHCGAAIAWHKDSVERALGEVKFFENTDDALNYGDIYSALVRFGGRPRRSDMKGVLLLGQTNITVAAWAAATDYFAGDIKSNGGKTYYALENMTSSAAFATDALKWKVIE